MTLRRLTHSSRAASRARQTSSAHAPQVSPAPSGSRGPVTSAPVWRVSGDQLIEVTTHREFDLVSHGLDRDAVVALAPRNPRILLGHFPEVTEVPEHDARISDALAELSTSGRHFTTFASAYAAEGQTIILIDYIS
jgi:hypothetical protein